MPKKSRVSHIVKMESLLVLLLACPPDLNFLCTSFRALSWLAIVLSESLPSPVMKHPGNMIYKSHSISYVRDREHSWK